MLATYVLALVVGGGLLALSLFGDFFDGDVDAEAEVGLDGSEVAKLLSLRALVYALFGFGGTGLVLHLIRAGAQPGSTALIAGAMGLGSGALVSALFGYLKRTEAGAVPGDRSLVGSSGTVLLDIPDGEAGTVRIRSGVRQYRMRARADVPLGAARTLEAGRSVVVVDVTDGVALVTPVNDRLLED